MSQRTIVIILILLGLYWLRITLHQMYDPRLHRGEGYSVQVPEGWKKQKVEGSTVYFVTEKEDVLEGSPEAILAIYAEKQQDALWLEDFFPEVVSAYEREGIRILDKGMLQIDKRNAAVILVYYEKPKKLFVLTYFVVDEFNRLFRIQFATSPTLFNAKYNKIFEDIKSRIKFKKFF